MGQLINGWSGTERGRSEVEQNSQNMLRYRVGERGDREPTHPVHQPWARPFIRSASLALHSTLG